MAQVLSGKYAAWRLYGINVTTGAITFQRGIYGSPSNDSAHHLQHPTSRTSGRACC